MDARTLELCRSMQRIADVIDARPELRARAAESTAFDHFKTVIALFAELQTEQYSSASELRQLDARRTALMDDLRLSLASIEATRALVCGDAATIPPLKQPARNVDANRFLYYVVPFIDMAASHGPAFIQEGLHPQTFDDARALIDSLIKVDRRHAYLDATFQSFDIRVEHVVEMATKRKSQLYFEFKRSLSAELRATWRQASSLGRTHRPKALRAGESQRQLPPATTGTNAEISPAPPAKGLKLLARNMMHRLAESGEGGG